MTPAKRARIYERDGNRCLHCGRAFNLTLDHIVPVSRGGGDSDSNLQTLCIDCNQSKANSLPAGFTARPKRRRALDVLRGLRHHPACDAVYCFVECPVYLFEHPRFAAARDKATDE